MVVCFEALDLCLDLRLNNKTIVVEMDMLAEICVIVLILVTNWSIL